MAFAFVAFGVRLRFIGLFFPLLMIACDAGPKVEPIAKALTCNCARVAVEGVIENRSPNYFSHSKFVLKDASGEVEVRSWLPIEVAPYHPDAVEEMQKRGEKWPPETMASYLGVPVRIYGRIDTGVDPPQLVVDYVEMRGKK